MGIGKTLRRALANLVIRAAEKQAKMACGNLQLYAGLEAVIEGTTHAIGHRRVERVRDRRLDGENEVEEATMEHDEEVNEVVAGLGLNNLRIETAVTEAEA